MTTLDARHLIKHYQGAPDPAVCDISFCLDEGEILALVGPSGCGKTTTLRLIAGLERPDAGEIWLGGRFAASQSAFVPPEKRGVGMVFQDHALFPHLNVFDNVAFGLRGKAPAQARQIAGEMLEMVGLAALAKRFPHALSGGERQRVSLARALAPRPLLLLMDEPFSSLDTDRRAEMREQVRGLLKAIRATVLFVTHDQEEALYMGDRLAVFNQGRLVQVGTPEAVFGASATRFVAEFMGGSRFLPGRITREGIYTEVGMLAQAVAAPAGTRVEVAVRADDVDFRPDSTGNGVIAERIFQGTLNVYRLRLDSGREVEAFKEHTATFPVGERVRVFVDAGHPLNVFAEGEENLDQFGARTPN